MEISEGFLDFTMVVAVTIIAAIAYAINAYSAWRGLNQAAQARA